MSTDLREQSVPRPRRHIVALALVGLVLAFGLDVPVHNWVKRIPASIERRDFTQFFRSGGYLPMWLGLAAVVALEDRRRSTSWSFASARRGITIAAAVIGAGIAAECLKLVCRRERPSITDDWYSFRPIWDRALVSGGLAMPSSHAIIAFTGAFMLTRYFPAGKYVFLLFAIGTAISRVYVGAHYLSDVYVSMLLAWCIAFSLPIECQFTPEAAEHNRMRNLAI